MGMKGLERKNFEMMLRRPARAGLNITPGKTISANLFSTREPALAVA